MSPPDEKQPPTRVYVYDVRPATMGEGFDLISDALSSGRLRFSKQHVAIGYATLHSGAHASRIHVYGADGQLAETREQPSARAEA